MEVPKIIRRIAMVSSKAAGMVALARPEAAIIGSLLELGLDLTEDKERTYEQELQKAINKAWISTVDHFSDISSYDSALKKFDSEVVIPDSLNKLLEKSDEYRRRDLTDQDVIEIVEYFDAELKRVSFESSLLKERYIISNTELTLEKLDMMVDILKGHYKKLEDIHNDIGYIHKDMCAIGNNVNKIKSSFQHVLVMIRQLINEATFVVIATGIFLLMHEIFSDNTSNILLITPISYAISEAFMLLFEQKKYLLVPKCDIINEAKSLYHSGANNKVKEVFQVAITKTIIPSVITVVFFYFLFNVTNNIEGAKLSLAAIFSLTSGNIISFVVKELFYDKVNVDDNDDDNNVSIIYL